MANPSNFPLHTFAASGNLTQQSEEETTNPLLSLPPDVLNGIIEYIIAANAATTPQQAAVAAIQWGRVAVLPHLLTHEPHVEGVINHAKHLDEALIILWNHIAPNLPGVPNMTTAPAIRLWMTDPNNTLLLGTIQRVDLSGRGLKIIPPEINTLHNLQTLHLEHNQITQVGPQAFAGCPALRELRLGNDSLLCKLNVDDENFLTRFNAFSGCACRSESAAFYRAVSEGRLSTPEIVEHLKQLEECNLIYEMVYWEAVAAAKKEGRAFSDEGGHQWGGHHVCDDMPIFYRALKKAVQEKFKRLSPEQKCAVHGNIYRIARENAGLTPDAPEWDDPNWDENHREDNVLVFIDAMQGV